MKVVYVGPLDRGGTCYARLLALQKIETDIHPFDIRPYFQGPSTFSKLVAMTFIGPRFASANKDLVAFCIAAKPRVVWIDKGFWVWPWTLKALRHNGVFLVQHNTDALYPRKLTYLWTYQLMRMTLRYYDLYFTSNIQDYAKLSSKTPPRTELTFNGYDHFRFNDLPVPADLAKKWSSSLLFIGHYEPQTEKRIMALIEEGLPVTVYGAGWERAKSREQLRSYIHCHQLDDVEYVYALKGAKIGLCFVSEFNRNETAGRSFEIPACGTFLLAMRTRQHSECYEEGKEAEFFGDYQELVQKARFYLEQENLRQEIAKHGHERCLRSDYSWARYMRQDWAKVKNILTERPAPIALRYRYGK